MDEDPLVLETTANPQHIAMVVTEWRSVNRTKTPAEIARQYSFPWGPEEIAAFNRLTTSDSRSSRPKVPGMVEIKPPDCGCGGT